MIFHVLTKKKRKYYIFLLISEYHHITPVRQHTVKNTSPHTHTLRVWCKSIVTTVPYFILQVTIVLHQALDTPTT